MRRQMWYLAAFTILSGVFLFGNPGEALAAPEETEVVVEMEEEDIDEPGEVMDQEVAAADLEIQQADSASAVRQNLVNYAMQFVGGKYRAGGSDPHTGADCSGFVKYVMQNGAGVSMNRSSGSQAMQGTPVSADQMQPGDLIFIVMVPESIMWGCI